MSEDEGVPSMVATWERALIGVSVVLEDLRSLYPARMMLLPETGHRALRDAMSDVQSSVANLHRAGRYVLGADGYDDYLANTIADDL